MASSHTNRGESGFKGVSAGYSSRILRFSWTRSCLQRQGSGVEMTLLSFLLPSKSDHRCLRRRARVALPRCMWFLLILCSAAACSRRPEAPQRLAPDGVALAANITCATVDCRTYNVQPYILYRSRYGIGCLGDVSPGATPNPERPPQSYRVKDIGRPSFPTLTSEEAALVKRVTHYVTSDTLRIAWVDRATTPKGFIIFDASDGPCTTGQQYRVLNGSCNEVYEPGENPYRTFPVPDCFPTKRPWLERHS
jgi:hypothetical protein